MKILTEKIVRGVRRVTVELAPGENLQAINPDKYYRLSDPMDDVIAGHILAGAAMANWCSIEQKWRT